MARSSRTVTLALGHPCCTGALCAHGRPTTAAEVDRALRGGGQRLLVRGAPSSPTALAALVRRGREAGFGEVALVSAALDRWVDSRAFDAVRAARPDVVRAVVFSHAAAVHDRLAGRRGALPRVLMTLRRLVASGTPVEVEAPLLPARLSDPGALVELILRAIDAPRAFRFYLPEHAVPPAVAPPRLDRVADLLAGAARRASEAHVPMALDPAGGLVPCAFARAPELLSRYALPGRRRRGRARRFRPLAPACGRCALSERCPGPPASYREAHGDAGLRPFERHPVQLRRARSGGADAAPRWGAAEREAARHAKVLVLRPTVHCNQDCLFCSANESSNNVWREPKAMLRAIVRAAQRGVRRVSFSGGEPTLSPHLHHFVDAARRLGVPEIEVVTNATLLDRPARVQRLADAGLTHAFVSLHAHDEALSRAMTQKVGDHERTLRGIDLLLSAGVVVAVNHVVTRRNQAYLSAFVERVARRFGGRVLISFAFVTPQYKALEHPELWPRLSETMPHLHRAMHRALALGQPFVVGSRQGVPPCFLGPFAAWSDLFEVGAEAASEDAPQKARGPACSSCRHRRLCQGLWRPYAARHGFGELIPVEGPAWTAAELEAIAAHHRPAPFGVPMSFGGAPPLLRDLAAEREPPPAAPEPPLRLPVHTPRRTRPLRTLFVGTGPRARRLAEVAAQVPGWALAAVASPHAPDRPGWWGAAPAFRDAAEALERSRPEAAVVAASCEAHPELLAACAAAGVPALVEKPVALDAAAADALLERMEGAWISCALQELFEPGLDALLHGESGPAGGPAAAPTLRLIRRCPRAAPDAPRAWARRPLFEVLHHALTLPVASGGGLREVSRASYEGEGRSERVRLELRLERADAEVELDFAAATDELTVARAGRLWRRQGRRVELDGEPVERAGSAEERMLAALGSAIGEGRPPPVPLALGVAVRSAAERAVLALGHAGAPFDRPGAPKHVASRPRPPRASRRAASADEGLG